MKLEPTNVGGVVVAESVPFRDQRGSFVRFFCAEVLKPIVGSRSIVQINCSTTRSRGAVRGMHFQHPPSAEMKLVRCLKGRLWDVALDLRAGSPTFLRWTAAELSAGDGRMLVIPEGCAHGFQTLEDDTEVLYLHTAYYDKPAEGAMNATDPAFAITWPLPIAERSERDRAHPYISSSFEGIKL